MATTTDLQSLISSFVTQLVSAVERTATERAHAAIVSAVGGATVVKRRGRPPKNPGLTLFSSGSVSQRRKPPKQFCPVPGCKNVAAPIFGMVCRDHKDVSKGKIKKYRAARKKAKAKAQA